MGKIFLNSTKKSSPTHSLKYVYYIRKWKFKSSQICEIFAENKIEMQLQTQELPWPTHDRLVPELFIYRCCVNK